MLNPVAFLLEQLRTERRTRRQLAFDVLAGIGLPALCFVFDPILFRNDWALAPDLALPFYAFSIAAAAALLAAYAGRPGRPALAGALFAAAAVSALVGTALLPLAVLGTWGVLEALFDGLDGMRGSTFLMFLLGGGPLGFVPLLCAGVYGRSALRELRACRARGTVRWASVLAGALLLSTVLVGGWGGRNRLVRGSIESLSAHGPAGHARELTVLRALAAADELMFAWSHARDEDERAQLAAAYRELTGGDVAARFEELQD